MTHALVDGRLAERGRGGAGAGAGAARGQALRGASTASDAAFESVADGGRRRRPDRVHVGHDRRAEGLHAPPPRPARDVRHVRPPHPRPAARGGLQRHAAARVHVRPRRARAVPAALRRVDRAVREAGARRRARGDRAPRDHDARSPRRPSTARCSRKATGRQLDSLRMCVSAGEPLPGERRRTRGSSAPASASSTASARPRCSTSSSRRARRTRSPARPGRRARLRGDDRRRRT